MSGTTFNKDSLVIIYTETTNDTTKSKICREISDHYYYVSHYDSALIYSYKSFIHAKEAKMNNRMADEIINYSSMLHNQKNFKKSKALALCSENFVVKNNDSLIIADFYYLVGQTYNRLLLIDSSEYYLKKSVKYDVKGIINANQTISNNCFNRGEYKKSLEYSNKALAIQIKHGNHKNQAKLLQSVASIYINLQDYLTAEKFLLESIQMSEEQNYTELLAMAHTKLSEVYFQTDRYKEMFMSAKTVLNTENDHEFYYNFSRPIILDGLVTYYAYFMSLHQQEQDSILKYDIVYNKSTANEVGTINYPPAKQRCIRYIEKLLKNAKEYNNSYYMSVGNLRKAEYAYQNNELNLSLKYYLEAFQIADSLNYNLLPKLSKNISKIYKKKRQFKEAYKWKIKHNELHNASYENEMINSLGSYVSKLTYLKKAAKDSILNAEKTKHYNQAIAFTNESISFERQFVYLLIFSFVVLFGLGFMGNREHNQTSQKNSIIHLQNEMISDQNILIDKKNNEIIESINYAKFIQEGILIKDENLIYSRTNDIVSRDFYFKHEEKNYQLNVLVDSGLVGIPGALLTIIGMSTLQEIMRSGKKDIHAIADEFFKKIDHLTERNFALEEIDIKVGFLLTEGKFTTFLGINQDLYHNQAGKTIRYESQTCLSKSQIQSIYVQKNDRLYMITSPQYSKPNKIIDLINNSTSWQTDKQTFENYYSKKEYDIDSSIVRIIV